MVILQTSIGVDCLINFSDCITYEILVSEEDKVQSYVKNYIMNIDDLQSLTLEVSSSLGFSSLKGMCVLRIRGPLISSISSRFRIMLPMNRSITFLTAGRRKSVSLQQLIISSNLPNTGRLDFLLSISIVIIFMV